MSQAKYAHIDSAIEQGNWDGSLLQCCGTDCTAADWIICCGAYKFPCILFGHNASRILNTQWWPRALLYYVVLMVVGLVGMKAYAYDAWLAVCLVKYKQHEDVDTACKRAMESGDIPKPPLTLDSLQFWVFMCALLGLVAWAAYYRKLLRQKLNIPGTYFGDFCRWCWCTPCALAQETRTILRQGMTRRNVPAWQNDVEDGGDLLAALYAPPHMEAPLVMDASKGRGDNELAVCRPVM